MRSFTRTALRVTFAGVVGLVAGVLLYLVLSGAAMKIVDAPAPEVAHPHPGQDPQGTGRPHGSRAP